jgi:hypothetical protein
MSGRVIERKHHVSRCTVAKALAFAEPPARKNGQEEVRVESQLIPANRPATR